MKNDLSGDPLVGAFIDPLDRRSLNSFRRTGGRQTNQTQIKVPKIVSLIDENNPVNQEPNETELDREINEQISNQRKRI